MWGNVCASLFLLIATAYAFPQNDENGFPRSDIDPKNDTVPVLRPKIKYLHYDTDIQNRYATTVVSSNMANPANVSQEVHFGLVLPDTAFISGFVMIIKNKEYKAYVKEKEKAKEDYDAAVAAGQSAAHIQQDVRDSNKFDVSVNIEAEGKVLFKLTYEELLSRTLGYYKNVVNVNPGQIVKDLVVKVNVKEPVAITHFSVPKFRTKNEISSEDEGADSLAQIEYDAKNKPTEASVTWSPTIEDQMKIAKDGLHGQLVVEYDVSRSTPSQILLDEGYFVHFFTPSESAPALPKHVVFVLDISGSMGGRKIEQLRDALVKILSDLNENDYFSIVLFSSEVLIWSPEKTNYLFVDRWSSHQPENSEIVNKRGDNEILRANQTNIQLAKEFAKKIEATSSTNIMGGLREGIDLIRKGQRKFSSESNDVDLPQPVMVFLTDGQPNVDISDPNEIVKKTVELNENITPIFSLAFGEGADFQFLRRLSLKNSGFARNIYEASDAALQLNNFYKEISSPQLAGVKFDYLPGQVKNGTLTTHHFPVFFRGSEIVIAGKLADENLNDKQISFDFTAKKNSDHSINYKEGGKNIIVIPFPRPLLPPSEANKTYSHLEKLWGFLTIKQLLDKDTSNKDDSKSNSPEKEQALQLALKYGFVTPLTSLVVVKPNDTDSTVEPEKASSANRFAQNFFNSGYVAHANPGGTYSSYASNVGSYSSNHGGGYSYSLPSFYFPPNPPALRAIFSINTQRTSFHQYSPRAGYGGGGFSSAWQPVPPVAPDSANIQFSTTFYPTTPIYTTPSSINEQTTISDEKVTDITAAPVPDVNATGILAGGSAPKVPVENVTWLASYAHSHNPIVISVPQRGNFTVGYNETDTLYGECNIQNEFTGYCRHLQYCALEAFVNSVDDYTKYFCPITNGFAGVCCPPDL